LKKFILLYCISFMHGYIMIPTIQFSQTKLLNLIQLVPFSFCLARLSFTETTQVQLGSQRSLKEETLESVGTRIFYR